MTEQAGATIHAQTYRICRAVRARYPDIHPAAEWYAALFDTHVNYENENYAFVQAPGVLYGFHPADEKCPGGIGGTTVYWEVEDVSLAIEDLVARGASLHRGPGKTSLGAAAAMLICPFGCTIGLNGATPESIAAIAEKLKGNRSNAA